VGAKRPGPAARATPQPPYQATAGAAHAPSPAPADEIPPAVPGFAARAWGAEWAPFDIPKGRVEGRVGARTRRFAENLQQQGIDLQKVNLDWAKVAAEQKEGAEKQVKLEILLDAIGKAGCLRQGR